MKIYDMHIHSRHGEPKPEELLEKMEQAGVYGGVLLSPAPMDYKKGQYICQMPYKERLAHVMKWTKNSHGRLFPFLWVNPFEKDALEMINDAAREGIMGYKMICDTFPVYAPEALKQIEVIAQTGLPILFHSGILYDAAPSAQYNRPANWEYLLPFPGLRFAMGHCSWPWHDECIAMYGKFQFNRSKAACSEMYFDLTRGTPKIYRRELLTKLYTVGMKVENNILFGTDANTAHYDSEEIKARIRYDNEIYDELALTEEQREKIYEKNLMRFLGKEK